MDATDEAQLRRAIALAAEARQGGDHPFGALIVARDGRLLAEAGNTVTRDGPTGHAELNAVRAVAEADRSSLPTATLYTSTEPCAMCAGACYWAGVGRIVFAFGEDMLRAMTGDDPANPTLALPSRDVLARGQRPTVIEGPALVAEARAVHQGFWRPG